jgi:hypothetical protein
MTRFATLDRIDTAVASAQARSPAARDAADSREAAEFAVALEYLAADLQLLADQAPVEKRDPLIAIVGLVRSLATLP